MSVLIKARRSPIANKDGHKFYYPQVKMSGTLTTKDLGDRIATKSALTRGDVRSVLDNMTEEINLALRDGKSVHLDGIGSLYLSVHCGGNGVLTKDKVSSNQIKKVRVLFREETSRKGPTTRAALSDDISFVMADDLAESLGKDGVVDDSGDANTGDDGGNTGGNTGGDTGGDTGDTGGDAGGGDLLG